MKTNELEKLIAQATPLPWDGFPIAHDKKNVTLAEYAVNNILRIQQERDELAEALKSLVEHYVANLGSDSEFIICITPPSAACMSKQERKHSPTWSRFDKARAILAKIEKGKK